MSAVGRRQYEETVQLLQRGLIIRAVLWVITEQRSFYQALETAIKIQSPPVALLAIVGFIELMGNKQGLDIEKEQALEILAFVCHHPASDHETKDKAATLFRTLQAKAPSQVVVAAQAQGESRNLEDVAAELLAVWPGR